MGVTRKDKIRNEQIRGSIQNVRQSRLRWYGRVKRRYDDHVAESARDSLGRVTQNVDGSLFVWTGKKKHFFFKFSVSRM